MSSGSLPKDPSLEPTQNTTQLGMDRLLQSLCGQVQEAMGVQLVKVLKLEPDEEVLRFFAGIGWKDGVIGREYVKLGNGSMAGYALLQDRAMVSENVKRETRFSVPEILREHGVKSAANAIIKIDGEPFGVIEIDSPKPRRFSAKDLSLLQHFANVVALTIGQHMLAERNQELLEESQLLLRELRHRVKNNNYLLRIMVQLQQHSATSAETKQALEAVVSRLTLTGVVNDVLTYSKSDEIDMGPFLLKVARSILRETEIEQTVQLDAQIAPLSISRDSAEGYAMILNEFLTNSLQHGPPGGGVVSIYGSEEAGRYVLSLSDNGPGFDPQKTPEGFGIRLISTMASQIGVEINWLYSPGVTLTVTIPDKEKAATL